MLGIYSDLNPPYQQGERTAGNHPTHCFETNPCDTRDTFVIPKNIDFRRIEGAPATCKQIKNIGRQDKRRIVTPGIQVAIAPLNTSSGRINRIPLAHGPA